MISIAENLLLEWHKISTSRISIVKSVSSVISIVKSVSNVIQNL